MCALKRMYSSLYCSGISKFRNAFIIRSIIFSILLVYMIWLFIHLESKQRSYSAEFENITNMPHPLTCHEICHRLNPQNQSQLLQMDLTKHLETSRTMDYIVQNTLPHLPGGAWSSKTHQINQEWNCQMGSSQGVAIIIPIRNRWSQLYFTLSQLIALLQKQQLCYRLFVIEQHGDGEFNKGRLMNAGYLEARKLFQSKCVVFQDADIAPIHEQIPYGCDTKTREKIIHLGVAVNSSNFKLLYSSCIGGVLKFSTNHFEDVNGFSNQYWGWGQEDDDMEKRIKARGLKYEHIAESIGRFVAVYHDMADTNRMGEHFELLKSTVTRMSQDGLNSIQYSVLNRLDGEVFTHFLIDVGYKTVGEK